MGATYLPGIIYFVTKNKSYNAMGENMVSSLFLYKTLQARERHRWMPSLDFIRCVNLSRSQSQRICLLIVHKYPLVKYLFSLFGYVFSINASVTSSTETVKSKTVIQMEKGKMYLLLNQFVKKVCMPDYILFNINFLFLSLACPSLYII